MRESGCLDASLNTVGSIPQGIFAIAHQREIAEGLFIVDPKRHATMSRRSRRQPLTQTPLCLPAYMPSPTRGEGTSMRIVAVRQAEKDSALRQFEPAPYFPPPGCNTSSTRLRAYAGEIGLMPKMER